MPHGKDIDWLNEVRDEVLEDQGLDDDDLPHLEEIQLEEAETTAAQIAVFERKASEDSDVHDTLTAEIDDSWLRLRELLLAQLSRLAEEEGVDLEGVEESQDVLADAIAERLVSNAEDG